MKIVDYPLLVNYDIDVGNLIKLLQLQARNSVLDGNFFSVSHGQAQLKALIIDFETEQIKTSEALAQMEQQHFRAGDLHELLFWAMYYYPNFQKDLPVVALGVKPTNRDYPSDLVIYLDESELRATFFKEWGPKCRFLAFKK